MEVSANVLLGAVVVCKGCVHLSSNGVGPWLCGCTFWPKAGDSATWGLLQQLDAGLSQIWKLEDSGAHHDVKLLGLHQHGVSIPAQVTLVKQVPGELHSLWQPAEQLLLRSACSCSSTVGITWDDDCTPLPGL